MQLGLNVTDALKNVVSDFTVNSNIATHKANADNHLNSYGLWNNKASIASSGMESSSLFGAAGAEASLGLGETGAIASEMNHLENSVFYLLAMITQGDGPMLTGMNEVIARQNAESNSNPLTEKIAKENTSKYKSLTELQDIVNQKVNSMMEMKSNLSTILDQNTLMFNGLLNAANDNVILSLQTADTRYANAPFDKKTTDITKSPAKPNEVKNDDDKDTKGKDDKNSKTENKQDNQTTTAKQNNNIQTSTNNSSPFSAVNSSVNTPNFSAPAASAPTIRPIGIA